MTLVVPDDGETLALKNWLNHTAPQNQVLKLFKNDITPSDGDTAASYTEATFTGYSSVALTGTSWTITSGTATYAEQSFISTAEQTLQYIYGYYVIQTTSGLLMWAERFSNGPLSISKDGDTIRITPSITAS